MGLHQSALGSALGRALVVRELLHGGFGVWGVAERIPEESCPRSETQLACTSRVGSCGDNTALSGAQGQDPGAERTVAIGQPQPVALPWCRPPGMSAGARSCTLMLLLLLLSVVGNWSGIDAQELTLCSPTGAELSDCNEGLNITATDIATLRSWGISGDWATYAIHPCNASPVHTLSNSQSV